MRLFRLIDAERAYLPVSLLCRINLIGTLSLEGEEIESLEYLILEGSCRAGEVIGYLDAVAEGAKREGKPIMVVLDNAPFDKAGAVRDA